MTALTIIIQVWGIPHIGCHTIAVDALAPIGARASAAMVLTLYYG